MHTRQEVPPAPEPFTVQGLLVSSMLDQQEGSSMHAVPSHISALLLTLPTFQLEMSLLKLLAPLNMFAMVVTAAVFHLLPSVLMALLNLAAF